MERSRSSSRTSVPAWVFAAAIAVGAGGVALTGCSYDYHALEGTASSNTNTNTSGGRSAIGTGGDAGRTAVTASGGRSDTGGSGNVVATGGRPADGGRGGAGDAPGTGGDGPRGGQSGGGGAGDGGGALGIGGVNGFAGAGGMRTSVGGDAAPLEADLVLWYKFDESSGTVASDSSGSAGGPRNAVLTTIGTGGAVTFSTTKKIVGTHALALTANGVKGGGYVVMPSVTALAPQDITIAVWVNFSSVNAWQRVFEFADTTLDNMSLTTSDGDNFPRFVIRTKGSATEQAIVGPKHLTLSAWHHLVVVLPAGGPYTGQLFIDGALAATNPAMSFHAADLGTTTNNFLGHSVFPNYPNLPGAVDDFRVYRRALKADEIAGLFTLR